MSVSVNEVALIAVVAVAAATIVVRTGSRWVGLIPLVFLVAALLSPADPVSTVAIALPNSILLICAARMAAQPGPNPTQQAG